jgi:hypothetical protein
MTNERHDRDPLLEREREEAQGVDVQMDPSRGAGLEEAREEAQGVEVFEDPDATLPARALKEGPPGQEILTKEALGRHLDDDDELVVETGR